MGHIYERRGIAEACAAKRAGVDAVDCGEFRLHRHGLMERRDGGERCCAMNDWAEAPPRLRRTLRSPSHH